MRWQRLLILVYTESVSFWFQGEGSSSPVLMLNVGKVVGFEY